MASRGGFGQALLRDYGLTLALLLVSGILLETTFLPRAQRNRELESEWRRRQQDIENLEHRVEVLGATDRARPDALMIESMARQSLGTLGLPENEIPVDPNLRGGGPNLR